MFWGTFRNINMYLYVTSRGASVEYSNTKVSLKHTGFPSLDVFGIVGIPLFQKLFSTIDDIA